MKNLDYAFLLFIYGNILTDKQRSVIELYYWEDLSLGEISECEGITRQAVRDSVKRSEQIFEDFESKLGFAEKIAKCRENCGSIRGYAEKLINLKEYDENIVENINELAAVTGDLF